MNKKTIIPIVVATALLLLVPLVAMQFSTEVKWSVFDFVVAGMLLSGTGLLYEWVASRAGNLWHKLAVGLAVGTGFLTIWINLAVGVIGSENNPANLMYLSVLATGFIGAIIGRFEPRGMAPAMFATALAQAVVAAVTVIAGFVTGEELVKTSFVNGFFIMLWVGSALLFRSASETARAV